MIHHYTAYSFKIQDLYCKTSVCNYTIQYARLTPTHLSGSWLP